MGAGLRSSPFTGPIANEPTEESTVKRTGTVRTNTVKGIVQFRNDRLREIGDYAQASEILRQIPLLLPGPPPYRLSYDKASRRLIYPVPHYRIVYGIALVESLEDGVRLISQEVVAATNHPFPSAAGKPALILLPSLEVCTSSDDVRFLRKHQNQRTAFKIYLYSLPTLMAGSLVYNASTGRSSNFVRSIAQSREVPWGFLFLTLQPRSRTNSRTDRLWALTFFFPLPGAHHADLAFVRITNPTNDLGAGFGPHVLRTLGAS